MTSTLFNPLATRAGLAVLLAVCFLMPPALAQSGGGPPGSDLTQKAVDDADTIAFEGVILPTLGEVGRAAAPYTKPACTPPPYGGLVLMAACGYAPVCLYDRVNVWCYTLFQGPARNHFICLVYQPYVSHPNVLKLVVPFAFGASLSVNKCMSPLESTTFYYGMCQPTAPVQFFCISGLDENGYETGFCLVYTRQVCIR